MSNFDGVLNPAAGWPDIPRASTTMVVLGGAGGPLNEQAKQLTARTKKLKEDIENISGAAQEAASGAVAAHKAESNAHSIENITGLRDELDSLAGGDLVSNLVNTEVKISDATTLDATAFGKMHACSGIIGDYTIILPSAQNNAGKMIGFRMENILKLSKRVTLKGNGSEGIDDQNTRIMWADESAILLSDGIQWKKISGRTIPFTFRAYLSANQPITAETATKVQLNAVSPGLDPGNVFDTTANRLIIPRKATWTFQGGINYAVGASGASAIAQLNKNGGNYQQLAFSHLSSTINVTLTGSAFDNAVAQDYYELIAYITLSTIISGVKYATFLSGQECYPW